MGMRGLLLSVLLLASPPAALAAKPALLAAAGKSDITPDLKKERIYLAGYGAKGRRAEGVADHLFARAIVVSDGKKTVALVSVDSIGFSRQDVLSLRRALGWAGKDKYLFLSATHSHAAPDTLGLWGRLPGISGVNKRYHERMKTAIVELVRGLSGRLRKAELVAARTLEHSGLCTDYRDPVVLDPEMNVLSFRTENGEAIGTLVRWSCHPEVLGSDNMRVSADFPGPMCAKIEDETGGACVFFPGAVGGLMSPAVDAKGVEEDYAAMVEFGEKVADIALKTLKSKPDRFAAGEVSFSSAAVRIPVENSRYLIFLGSLLFGHKLYDPNGEEISKWGARRLTLRHLVTFPMDRERLPRVETEISLVRIGPVKLLGVPGELFPELAIGGYGGEHRYGSPLIRPGNSNPPRLGKAPKPPYLREKLGAEHGLIVGLANDMIGYVVPSYDFEITPSRSMSPRPPGTHYEETNSVGSLVAPILLEAYDKLLGE